MFGFNPLYTAVLGLMGGPSPAFALDFLASSTLNPAVVTFSRAGNATQFDSLGRLVWAPSQLLSATNNLANGTRWTALGSLPVVITSGQTDPVGGTDAFLIDVSAFADCRVAQDVGGGKTPAGGSVTMSVWIRTVPGDPAGTWGMQFRKKDATTPVTTVAINSTWQRISWTLDLGAGASSALWWMAQRSAGGTSHRALLWQPMMSLGDVVWPYIENTDVSGTIAVYGPRFDYNPATLAARGWLVEPLATNSIRNSEMVGGVAGTPGTAPTNWAVSAIAGVTITTAYGTEDGIPYIDVTYSGTNTSGSTAFPTISIDGAGAIAAANAQTWTRSAYVRKVAGADAITDWFVGTVGRDSAQALISGQSILIAASTSAQLRTARVSATFTFTDPLVAFIQPRITRTSLAAGATIDITIRIGGNQLEQSSLGVATSYIPTFGTAATRAADVQFVEPISWYNLLGGTFVCEVETLDIPGGTKTFYNLSNGGATSERMQLRQTGSNTITNIITVANVVQSGAPFTGALTPGIIKSAYQIAAGAQKLSVNGAAVVAGTAAAMPNPTRLQLGSLQSSGNEHLTGWLRKLEYFDKRDFSNVELQARSTP